MIKVINNFFGEEIQKEIWKKMMRPKWSYTGGGTTRNRFWDMDGLEKEEYFNEYLYKIICKKLDKKFSSIKCGNGSGNALPLSVSIFQFRTKVNKIFSIKNNKWFHVVIFYYTYRFIIT